ncbi:MAG TPA: hypothetical protein EYO60_06370, partial [Candidatus Lambdaproteobacteria bacterium]|nr:hypothetical protein [Candidatus Lambdaproteobacteria bacterium]
MYDQAHELRQQDELIREMVETRDQFLATTPGFENPTKTTPGFENPTKKTPPPSPQKTPPVSPIKDDGALSGGGREKPRFDIPVMPVQDPSQCILFDPDEVYCTPVPLSNAKLKKKQATVIQNMTFRRKLMCEKLHLMQMTLKELEVNQRLWKAFEHSRQGDFMATFSKKDLSQFQKCGKNAIWTPSQLHELKAVTACLQRSQELCKNYREGKARFQDAEVLGSKNYMLGNFSVEELETMRRSYGDPWVKRALKNREREPVYNRQQLICESGPRQEVILQKQIPPTLEKPVEKQVAGIQTAGLGPSAIGSAIGPSIGTSAIGPPGPQTRVAGIQAVIDPTVGRTVPPEQRHISIASTSAPSESVRHVPLVDITHDIYDPVKEVYLCTEFVNDIRQIMSNGKLSTKKYERAMEKWRSLPLRRIDPEIAYFLEHMFRISGSLTSRYDYHEKFDYFLKVLGRICIPKQIKRLRFSNQPCPRIKQYIVALQTKWLHQDDFTNFLLEAQDVAKKADTPRETQAVTQILKTIKPNLGFRTREQARLFGDKLQQLCKKRVRTELSVNCQEFLKTFLEERKNPGSTSKERFRRYIEEAMHYADVDIKNTQALRRRISVFANGRLPDSEFYQMMYRLFLACTGQARTAWNPSEYCAKLIFRLFYDFFIGLPPDVKTKLETQINQVQAKARNLDLNRLINLWKYRRDEFTNNINNWHQLQGFLQNHCDQDTREVDPTKREFCDKLQERLRNFIQTRPEHHPISLRQALRENVGQIIALAPDAFRKELQETFEKIYTRQFTDSVELNRLEVWIHKVCTAQSFQSELCRNVDFLLMCLMNKFPISEAAWDYLRKAISQTIGDHQIWDNIVAHKGHIGDSEFTEFRRWFKQVCEQGAWNPEEVDIRSAPVSVHVPIRDTSMRHGIDLTRSLAPSLAQSEEKVASMIDIASVPSHVRVYDDLARESVYAGMQEEGDPRLTDIRHMPSLQVETLRAAVADAQREVHDL